MGLREYAAQQVQEVPKAQEAEKIQSNTASPLYREQKEQRAAADQAASVYKEYQNAIKTVSSLEAEILNGLAAGENIAALFLKAARALSLLTGNRLFYDQIVEDIGSVYGYALQDHAAAELERDNIKQRLQKLEQAAAAPDNPNRDNINRAIRAHRAQLERITGTRQTE